MAVAHRPFSQNIGLFLLLVIAADLLFAVASAPVSARMLMQEFYLLAFVHIGQSLYGGIFSRLRTVTWVILIAGWTAAEALSFVGHILPFGQALFWISANMPWAAAALQWLAANVYVMPITMLALLTIDVVVQLRAQPGFSWRTFGLLAVVAVIVALAGRFAYLHLQPQQAPELVPSFDILPPWHLLPFYAMLRSIPDKAAGVTIALLAILAPIVWPWMRVEALRLGRMRWVWRLAWLAFVASFIGLGYLGAQTPEDNVILASRVLAGWYLAFLLVVPIVLKRFDRA